MKEDEDEGQQIFRKCSIFHVFGDVTANLNFTHKEIKGILKLRLLGLPFAI
jgi:hypothetical protein